MKNTDFTIGDWVSYKGKPHKVGGVASEYVYLGFGLVIPSNDIVAIPLTTEILEANGWKKIDGFPTWVLYNDICGSMFISWNPETKFTTLNKVDVHADCLCENVHEFQRALRLCALNDLADNFKLV